MAQQVAEVVLQAVATLQSPTAQLQQRKEATLFIEQVRAAASERASREGGTGSIWMAGTHAVSTAHSQLLSGGASRLQVKKGDAHVLLAVGGTLVAAHLPIEVRVVGFSLLTDLVSGVRRCGVSASSTASSPGAGGHPAQRQTVLAARPPAGRTAARAEAGPRTAPAAHTQRRTPQLRRPWRHAVPQAKLRWAELGDVEKAQLSQLSMAQATAGEQQAAQQQHARHPTPPSAAAGRLHADGWAAALCRRFGRAPFASLRLRSAGGGPGVAPPQGQVRGAAVGAHPAAGH